MSLHTDLDGGETRIQLLGALGAEARALAGAAAAAARAEEEEQAAAARAAKRA